MRVHKLMARAGVASLRTSERYISACRVRVNGQIARLGQLVDPQRDRITVDGKVLHLQSDAPARLLMYHKSTNEIVSRNDPEGRLSVFASLPRLNQGRWISVGRLDLQSSGLLLFTNDGILAHRLMHPATAIEREYAVRVYGLLSPADRARLTRGVQLEDGPARLKRIRPAGGEGKNRWYHVTVSSGRNRIIRRMIAACGATVSRLIRIRYGRFWLPSHLKVGNWTALSGAEMEELLRYD